MIREKMPEIDLHWVGYSIYTPGSSFGPYTVSYQELVWIDTGEATLTTCGRTHPLRPNSVVLSSPGTQNTYRWDPSTTTAHGYALFTTSQPLTEPHRIWHLDDEDVVPPLLKHLRWLDAERPPRWRTLAEDTLLFVLRALDLGATRTSPQMVGAVNPIIEGALALVRERWANGAPLRPPTLDELALAAAVSPEHLCRVFKAEVGFSPLAALRLLRLHRTATLLSRSNQSIGAVARECGFDNAYHFSRTFKQTFGVAPRDFRRSGELGSELPQSLRRLASYV